VRVPSKTANPKLIAPQTTQVVRRERVMGAIEWASKTGACWIVAPAGYGKSIAAADYLKKKRARYIWYRVDTSDQDIASFFHYLTEGLRRPSAAKRLPVFGAEYADQAIAFAQRFFRTYFAQLEKGTILVLDDLHYADAPPFRAILATLLSELPDSIRCLCLSRKAPGVELTRLRKRGALGVVDRRALTFSKGEARALVRARLQTAAASLDLEDAHGWAAGLVLLAERAGSGQQHTSGAQSADRDESAAFAALAVHFVDALPQGQRDTLLRLSVLPAIRPDLARALIGAAAAAPVLDLLQHRQLLLTRGESTQAVFHLHDLLRAYLQERLAKEMSPAQLSELREQAARLLHEDGSENIAVDLALQAQAWPLAHRWIATLAERLLAQGRRATLIEWCAALPDTELDAWLCYWLGVATSSEDATAEAWFARAWDEFKSDGDLRGQCLTAARAVLAKTDSWRTHQGLATWTGRVIALIGRDLPQLVEGEHLLVRTGMLRAIDFAADYRSDAPAVAALTTWLLERLATRHEGDTVTLRLLASAALIDHAGSTGQQTVFEQAVDSVREDLRDRDALPWAVGLWLVNFGAISARYFTYQRRGFPYGSAEDALRAAIAIGEREVLRGVEFGALYHLQLQMKARNDFQEFSGAVGRLAQIADSRYTTQVAVVADCQAALHTLQGHYAPAHRACQQFMTAIDAADEPPLERWPHYITLFQVLLAEQRPDEAAGYLRELLQQFDGGIRRRTQACISIAETFAARWRNDAGYPQQLHNCIQEIRQANWPAILLNLPSLLAELTGDALERHIEPEFCRALIVRRSLSPPATRPASWPWPLKLHLLGEFRLERDGSPLDLGAKPPTRSLDLLRTLAVAKDHACPLEQLHEWIWPDADGDQAKAACEQALHRLRKLLGSPDLVQQREGKLRLAPDKVWVDVEHWERSVTRALAGSTATHREWMERAFYDFAGPMLQSQRMSSWMLPAAERVRSKFVHLAMNLGQGFAASGDAARTRSVYLRIIDMYPTSERAYAALLRARLAEGDAAGALEDYRRYERTLASTLHTAPSRTIRALIAPVLP